MNRSIECPVFERKKEVAINRIGCGFRLCIQSYTGAGSGFPIEPVCQPGKHIRCGLELCGDMLAGESHIGCVGREFTVFCLEIQSLCQRNKFIGRAVIEENRYLNLGFSEFLRL